MPGLVFCGQAGVAAVHAHVFVVPVSAIHKRAIGFQKPSFQPSPANGGNS